MTTQAQRLLNLHASRDTLTELATNEAVAILISSANFDEAIKFRFDDDSELVIEPLNGKFVHAISIIKESTAKTLVESYPDQTALLGHAARVAVFENQDWDNGVTTYTFEDGSSIIACGSDTTIKEAHNA